MSYGRPQQSKAQNDANAKTLRAAVKHPDNKTCADCKRNDPRWASWNIGCYLCIRCSGIHRSMGTHISKVKSIDLDIWTPEQMEAIQKWGNRRCNLYWEAHLKPGHVPPDHKIESFIRSKYEMRRWAREGPVPDPATLDPASESTPEPAQAPAVGSSTSTTRSASSSLVSAPPANKPTNVGGGGIMDLLDDPVPSGTTASNVVASKSPAVPAQTSAGSGLFDLDWSSAPTTASAGGGGGGAAPATPASPVSAGGTRGKDDILSLFGAPRPAVPSAGAGAGGAGGFGGLNASFGGLNMGGGGGGGGGGGPSNGTGATAVPALDASNPWGAGSAAAAPAARSNSLFDSQDVWGAAKPAAAAGGGGGFGDIWGSTTSSAATTQTSTGATAAAAAKKKKDDAFADIWGDFK
ncbi:unnamed protein product [Tilletia controversa]|nr:unnamed protein product [Tilletia controversa]